MDASKRYVRRGTAIPSETPKPKAWVKPRISRKPFPGSTTVVILSSDGADRDVAVADTVDVDHDKVRGR